jgi:rhodanese-related sulfurtransferase
MKTTDKPLYQEFHLNGVKNISADDAYDELINHRAIMIDVREEEETERESIPLENVVYHPMSQIMDRLAMIPKDKSIIVLCPGGVRSTKIVNLLNIQGYTSAANLDGGLNLWKIKGYPVKVNSQGCTGCSCGCSNPSEDCK